VIGLARAFGRQVIAEGLESIEHGELLLRLGCDVAQGYFIARPMPPAEVPDWVAKFVAPARWQVLNQAV
jgi:EAL domain-containing protein (putative c-di-GMP-specific phosphodiesterase class I)